MNLKIYKTKPEAIMPVYSTEGSSGMDIFSTQEYILAPGETKKIPVHLTFDIPKGYEIQVRPKSGLAANNGIFCILGTIDSDYTGSINAILYNSTKKPFFIEKKQKIAQIVMQEVIRMNLIEDSIENLKTTERGNGGFGSTGKFND